MFELSEEEYNVLKDRLRSQIASLEIDGKGKYLNIRRLPSPKKVLQCYREFCVVL